MKIKPEHIDHMREAMRPLLPKIAAHREGLKINPKVKDLEKRVRWDWLYAAVPSVWVCDNIYPYANDTHIDTALRSIAAELEAMAERMETKANL